MESFGINKWGIGEIIGQVKSEKGVKNECRRAQRPGGQTLNTWFCFGCESALLCTDS